MKRVGIYAGTFDPIHNGHLAFAEAALIHGLDKVFFLIEPRPRRKQGVRALEHRIAMASIAARSHPKMGVIQLEHARFTPSHTLPHLSARFKGSELVLLFGDDVIKHMVDNLAEWPHLEDLAKDASLLIAARHHQVKDLELGLKNLKKYGLNFRYSFIEPGESAVSSSTIRQAMKHAQSSPHLPQAVQEYANEQKLYSSISTK